MPSRFTSMLQYFAKIGASLFAASSLMTLTVSAQAATISPYNPYGALIGKWNISGQPGQAPVATAEFKWGPSQSYIWFAGTLMDQSGVQHPHFEGILAWNGIRKNLDMLLEVDLRSGLVDEAGTFSIAPDGTFIRDITASFSEGSRPMSMPVTGPNGTVVHFRQTFKQTGPDEMITAVLRDSGHGDFVPTFPGSDHLVMVRSSSGS